MVMRTQLPAWLTVVTLVVAGAVMLVPVVPATLAQDDPDRSELIEDLDLGLPVSINLGTCATVVAEPSFTIGPAQPAPLLTLDDETRPLLGDDPAEDELLPPEEMSLLAENGQAVPPSIIWQAEEEIDAELDDLLSEPHVILVSFDAGEAASLVACGEIGDDQIEEGKVIVPIRQVDDSAFAGVAILDADEGGFFGFGDEAVGVEVVIFHGLTAPTGAAATPPAGEAAATAAPTAPAAGSSPASASPTAAAARAATPAADTSAEAVTVEMVDIDFNPNEFAIPANTDVTVRLPNAGAVVHNFNIDGLGVHSGDVQPGNTGEVTITAEAGEYTYYCSIPGHRQAGMAGTLTVE